MIILSSRRRAVTAAAIGVAMAAAVGAATLTTTAAQAASGCRVDYAIASSWPGGFGANVTIVNLGAPVSGWKLAWSFTAGQTVTQLWGGGVTQSGAQVTVTNASYNGGIATNGTATFGFNGTWNGANPAPASFDLNGTTCTGDLASPTTPGGPSPTSPGPTPSGPPVGSGGGSGPYPAGYETSGGLPNHTIYRPERLPDERMPIFVWANGACTANGTASLNFLREISSHGFLVISNGSPNGTGTETAAMLTQAIDWAVAENTRSGSKYLGRLNTGRIAVAGFSCGGLEAYEVATDPRITTIGIFSSGLLDDAKDYQLARLTKPIAYIIGGPSDIAYPNAIDDWGKLPAGLPAFMGNLDVGHGGTYTQPNGGEFGRVAVLYLKWRLYGDTTAGAYFVGANCGLCGTQWQVRQKNLTL